MESTTHNSHSKIKAILAIVGIVFSCVLVIGLIMHMTLDVMANTLFDFASHHYFLMIFISLVIFAASIKTYTSLDENIDRHFRERHSVELSKNRRKRLKFSNLFKSNAEVTTEDGSKFIKMDEVSKLKFADSDVLLHDEEILQRHRDVQKATILGNSYKQKVMILFKDNESKKHLITTIWQSTSEHINLKGGIVLPVKSIMKIEF